MTRPDAPEETTHIGLVMPWSRSGRRVPRLVVRPLQQFLHTEASGGVLLLVAAACALTWANVWPGSYTRAWGTELTIGVGDWSITEDLRHWVNDGLMAIFFFVVGLEIKRELVVGRAARPARRRACRRSPRSAAWSCRPLIYVAIVGGGAGATGWGIPMATDIAFARRRRWRSSVGACRSGLSCFLLRSRSSTTSARSSSSPSSTRTTSRRWRSPQSPGAAGAGRAARRLQVRAPCGHTSSLGLAALAGRVRVGRARDDRRRRARARSRRRASFQPAARGQREARRVADGLPTSLSRRRVHAGAVARIVDAALAGGDRRRSRDSNTLSTRGRAS